MQLFWSSWVLKHILMSFVNIWGITGEYKIQHLFNVGLIFQRSHFSVKSRFCAVIADQIMDYYKCSSLLAPLLCWWVCCCRVHSGCISLSLVPHHRLIDAFGCTFQHWEISMGLHTLLFRHCVASSKGRADILFPGALNLWCLLKCLQHVPALFWSDDEWDRIPQRGWLWSIPGTEASQNEQLAYLPLKCIRAIPCQQWSALQPLQNIKG